MPQVVAGAWGTYRIFSSLLDVRAGHCFLLPRFNFVLLLHHKQPSLGNYGLRVRPSPGVTLQSSVVLPGFTAG